MIILINNSVLRIRKCHTGTSYLDNRVQADAINAIFCHNKKIALK